MALLSQALHLGYLLSPHSAFQGHAAHTARWPAMLSPSGSSGTCISDGVFHIPMPCLHGAIPGYPKVLLHFSIMLRGAAQARGTRPSARYGWRSRHGWPRWPCSPSWDDSSLRLSNGTSVSLRDHDRHIPGKKGPTATPTAAVVFALFPPVTLVHFAVDNST